MRNLVLALFLLISFSGRSQIKFVDNGKPKPANKSELTTIGFRAGIDITDKLSPSAAISMLWLSNKKSGIFTRNALLAEASYRSARYNRVTPTANIHSAVLSLRPRKYIGFFHDVASGLHIDIGPYAAYNFSAKAENTRNDTDTDLNDILRPANVGLTGSVGYTFFVIASLEYNYSLGLIPLFRDTEIRSNIHNISLCFSIPL